MRKITKLMMTLLLMTVSVTTYAYDVAFDGIYYNLNTSDNTAEVTYYSKSYGIYYDDIEIPSEIEDYEGVTYKVTSIGEYAFYRCGSLASVTIPNSVTSIGSSAFLECTSLASVTIPNSVTSIGSSAFYGCEGLASVTIPNSVTSIGSSAFYGCESLASVTIPNSVTFIDGYTFYGCTSLASVTIPNSVTYVGKSAFEDCTSLPVENDLRYADTYLVGPVDYALKDYTIKNGTRFIGNYAFFDFTDLESISIPNTIEKIGAAAFSGCTGLREIYSWNPTPPTCSTTTFTDVKSAHCKLYVPEGSKDAYEWSDGWADFLNVIEMSSSEELTPGTEVLALTDATPEFVTAIYDKGNISYTRKLTSGKYATFCLPYEISLADYNSYFSKVYIPMNIAFYRTDGMLLLMLANKPLTETIPAGTPFLALSKSDGTVAFKNSLVTALSESTADPDPTTLKIYNFNGTSGSLYENEDLDVKIGGSYKKMVDLDENYYRAFNTAGQFGPTEWLNPFRMYVYKNDGSSNSRITDIVLSFDDDDTTDIEQLMQKASTTSDAIYNIHGQKVNSADKGLYIINGKKVIK